MFLSCPLSAAVTTIAKMYSLFSISPPSVTADCCLFQFIFHRTPPCLYPSLLLCYLCGLRGPLLPLNSRLEVIRWSVPSSADLCSASAPVFLTTAAAESTPPTLLPVAETFVRVLLGFGGGWKSIWRLRRPWSGVWVVEVSDFGVKMARKEQKHQKFIHLRTNGVQNHRRGIKHIGTQVMVRWPSNSAALWL